MSITELLMKPSNRGRKSKRPCLSEGTTSFQRVETPRPGLLDELVTPQMVVSAVLALWAMNKSTYSEDLIEYVTSRYRLLETEELMIDMELAIEVLLRLGLIYEQEGCFFTNRCSAALDRDELDAYYKELGRLRIAAQKSKDEEIKQIPRTQEESTMTQQIETKTSEDQPPGNDVSSCCWTLVCEHTDGNNVKKRAHSPNDLERTPRPEVEDKKRRLSPQPVHQNPAPEDEENPDQPGSSEFSSQTTKMKLCQWKPVSLQLLVKTLRSLRRLPVPPSLDDLAINISSRHQVCQNMKRLLAEIELKATIAEQLGIIRKDHENRLILTEKYMTGLLNENDLKQFWRRYYRSKYLARYLPCSEGQEDQSESKKTPSVGSHKCCLKSGVCLEKMNLKREMGEDENDEEEIEEEEEEEEEDDDDDEGEDEEDESEEEEEEETANVSKDTEETEDTTSTTCD